MIAKPSGVSGAVFSPRLRRCLPCVAILLLALPPLAAGRAGAHQQSVFEATVSRVRVDVIVTDEEGNFVDDLRPEDFVVYEDGTPQQVLSLQRVNLGSGLVVDVEPSAAGERLPADEMAPEGGETPRKPPTELARATNPAAATDPARAAELGRATGLSTAADSAPAPDPAPTTDLGAMVYLIDFPGLDWKNKARFANVWREMLAETDTLDIPRAVYMIDQLGYLKELVPLTFDIRQLREAAETVRMSPLVRQAMHRRLVEGDRELDALASDREQLVRSRGTLEMLAQFCNALSTRQGRTALVWVTSEIQLMEGGPFAAYAAAAWEAAQDANVDAGVSGESRAKRSGNTPFKHITPDAGTTRLQRELHEAANSANVSIYAIDPTPVTERHAIFMDVEASAESSGLLGGLAVQASLDGLRDAQRQASHETGGLSFIGWADLRGALTRIDNDSNRFYLMTYATPSPQGDGSYHDIQVDVLRPGLSVRARSGYVDLPSDVRRSQTLAAALALPGTVTGLPLSGKAIRRWSAEGQPVVELIAAVQMEPAEAALPSEQGSDSRRGSESTLEFHAAVVSPKTGKIIDEVHEDVVPVGLIRGAPDAQPSRPFIYIHDWSLAPGEYELRVAVRDQADRLGATRLEVSVPEPSDEWRASDLMLLAAGQDGPPRPLVDGVMRAGQVLHAYIEVAGGRLPVFSGQVFDADGTTSLIDLPMEVLQETPAGIHQGNLRVQVLLPGTYVLHLSLTDHAAGEQAVFQERIEVLEAASGAISRESSAR